jgi:ABC-type multidrug transport system ATPase subunit
MRYCLLCQRSLDPEARDRLGRFERFVKDDIQTKLATARERWEEKVANLQSLPTSPEAIEITLTDLETQHADLIETTRQLVAEFEAVRATLDKAISESRDLPLSGISSAPTTSLLETAASTLKTEADKLSDFEAIKRRRLEITKRRRELELLKRLKDDRKTVITEIARLKENARLEEAKTGAATTGITKKILEFSEDNITEVVRDTFTRETDRLHLERVTITRTRGERGALLHQPKLVGARQAVSLPRVFSEGERTALGLAAFFTETHLDSSKSAIVLDDPVSSLDHVRRALVAAKLANLAQERQVVVFTHDVSFVADLKREARGVSVTVAERSVVRARGGERKPGTCTKMHPWKAKDVAERIDELKRDLARIRKESEQWDDDTYGREVSDWAGRLSETWERVFSQEIVGPLVAEGGVEVRPNMVKILASFTQTDDDEFQASYSRVSQWATRHDKSVKVNYVAPEVNMLEKELSVVEIWFKRVKAYKNQ